MGEGWSEDKIAWFRLRRKDEKERESLRAGSLDYALRFPLDGTTEVVWLQLTPYLIALNFDYDLAFKRLNRSMMRSREAAAIRRLLHSVHMQQHCFQPISFTGEFSFHE